MRKDINIDLSDKTEKHIKVIKDTENIKKMKSQKEQIEKKNEAGITIITLVVTILIIIILASITINAVLGDDGLLRQAQDAKDLAESTTIETGEKMNKVLQEYMNVMAEDEGGGITEPEEDTTPPTVIITEGEITENSIEVNVTANDPESGLASENPYIYYLNGEEKARNNSNSYTFTNLTASTQYTIKVEVYNGVGIKGENSITVSTSAKPGLSADEIRQNPTSYYGAEVTGYSTGHSETSNAVSKWRIFYAGPTPGGSESNIYLIADDYIASEYAPEGKEGSRVDVNSTNYRLSFYHIKNDYAGSSAISASSLARKWIEIYLNSYTSANNNIKAVAYLMDTNVWSSYAGSVAEYAIGGPTLELFCASYRDTHSSRYLKCDSVTSTGYQIKWSDSSSYNYSVDKLIQDEFNSIYIKSDDTKAFGMCLASPSAADSDGLFGADYNGSINYHYYNGDNPGLRPIVCLKSNVQLEEQGDGTYAIIQ